MNKSTSFVFAVIAAFATSGCAKNLENKKNGTSSPSPSVTSHESQGDLSVKYIQCTAEKREVYIDLSKSNFETAEFQDVGVSYRSLNPETAPQVFVSDSNNVMPTQDGVRFTFAKTRGASIAVLLANETAVKGEFRLTPTSSVENLECQLLGADLYPSGMGKTTTPVTPTPPANPASLKMGFTMRGEWPHQNWSGNWYALKIFLTPKLATSPVGMPKGVTKFSGAKLTSHTLADCKLTSASGYLFSGRDTRYQSDITLEFEGSCRDAWDKLRDGKPLTVSIQEAQDYDTKLKVQNIEFELE